MAKPPVPPNAQVIDVASQYPAVVDSNGTVWYRPDYDGRSPPQMWGWTSDPDQAHPDYWYIRPTAVPPQPQPQPREDNPVTELATDGAPDTGRYSDFMRYPLPPPAPREEVQFDGYGRYKIPSPTTGRLTSYTRATTVASSTSDHFMLNQWKIRTKVTGVLRAADLHTRKDTEGLTDAEYELANAYALLLEAMKGGTAKKINDAIDLIDDLAGGADAKELGGAVHDWLGELDMGRVLLQQIPEQFQPYAIAYQDALHRAGLVAVPEYVERLVLNDRGKETVAGRLDRIYRIVETGELVLGDLKTSKTLDFSLLEYAIQFAVYGYATLMLNLDGKTWGAMPDINQEFCVCVHVPSDQPDRSQVVPFDLWAGGEGMITAIEVRDQRKDIPKRVLGHTTPIPSRDTLRYVEARQRIQSITSMDDAVALREEYEDVWTDDLTEFGAQCFELLATTEQE